GREKSVKRRHPWIFSGAIARVGDQPKSGDTVEVRSASGEVLARAAYSPQSQIRARVWTFDAAQEVDAAFFRQRITQALALREGLPAARHGNAMRLVHAESDGLPGLVVDRYADVLVAQFPAAGVERWREPIFNALAGGAARVTAVESSAPSLEVARENLAANALDGSKVEFVHADAFSHLRTLRDRGAHFDLVVLDPPKFAPTAAQARNAARAY